MIFYNDLAMMLSGRVGESKGDSMYHWVEDKDFLKRSYSLCADIVNQLVQKRKQDFIGMLLLYRTHNQKVIIER